MLFIISAIQLLLLTCLTLVSAWDINSSSDRAACQSITSSLLQGCDANNTVLVSAVTEGAFETIQSGVFGLAQSLCFSWLTSIQLCYRYQIIRVRSYIFKDCPYLARLEQNKKHSSSTEDVRLTSLCQMPTLS